MLLHIRNQETSAERDIEMPTSGPKAMAGLMLLMATATTNSCETFTGWLERWLLERDATIVAALWIGSMAPTRFVLKGHDAPDENMPRDPRWELQLPPEQNTVHPALPRQLKPGARTFGPTAGDRRHLLPNTMFEVSAETLLEARRHYVVFLRHLGMEGFEVLQAVNAALEKSPLALANRFCPSQVRELFHGWVLDKMGDHYVLKAPGDPVELVIGIYSGRWRLYRDGRGIAEGEVPIYSVVEEPQVISCIVAARKAL